MQKWAALFQGEHGFFEGADACLLACSRMGDSEFFELVNRQIRGCALAIGYAVEGIIVKEIGHAVLAATRSTSGVGALFGRMMIASSVFSVCCGIAAMGNDQRVADRFANRVCSSSVSGGGDSIRMDDSATFTP